MHPEHIDLLPLISAPTVHPDGLCTVVAVARASFAADDYVGQLWRIDLDGGEPRRITRGYADAAPQFSPDGALIGFLRRSPGGKPQVYVMPASGGEPAQATDAKGGVSEFTFSPDGSRLAYISRAAEEGRYGTVDGVSADQENPRRFNDLTTQANGIGWFLDRPASVFVTVTPDPTAAPPIKPVGRAAQAAKDAEETFSPVAEATRLTTEGDWAHPIWDGDAVCAITARPEEVGHTLLSTIWRLHPDAEPEDVLPYVHDHAIEAIGHVGGQLMVVAGCVGESGRDFVGRNGQLFRVADGHLTPLTDAEDLDLHADGRITSHDGGALVALVSHGTRHLLHITPDGDATTLEDGITIIGVGAGGDRVVVTAATPTSPGEVYLVGAEPRQLTQFGADLAAAASVRPAREVVATADDGYDVHGWVVLPDGDGPHPVLLNIHGGPYADYTEVFFDEAQVYAEAGYAVVMCNPRGSAGYGQAHGRAIKGAFGDRDMHDIVAFLDHCLATESLDADRVGIMGGSYGGYMTAWIIAHTDRFRGAIVERGFLDPSSFIGASDIGWFFIDEYNGPDAASRDPQSPTLVADRVTTPTLVLHSEQDLRCPLGQALRYYTELKRGGVEAELLVFPGENHELSRSGTPWHRRHRFEAILAWWQRHLA